MPINSEETGVSSSIVRNLTQETTRSKLDRCVDYVLKMVIDPRYKYFFAISLWFTMGFICRPESLLEAGWPTRLVAFIILALSINMMVTTAWTCYGLYNNIPNPIQTFKILSSQMLDNIKTAFNTNINLIINQLKSTTWGERINLSQKLINQILERYTEGSLAFHYEIVKNWIGRETADKLLKLSETDLSPTFLDKLTSTVKGIDYKKEMKQVTEKCKQIMSQSISDDFDSMDFMKSMIKTGAVAHQANIQLLISPPNTRLELPSPEDSNPIILYTPPSEEKDKLFVSFLKDVTNYDTFSVVYNALMNPEQGLYKLPNIIEETLTNISKNTPELGVFFTQSRIQSIVNTTKNEIKVFEISLKDESKQTIKRATDVISGSNPLRNILNTVGIIGLYSIPQSDWWDKIDIQIGFFELLILFLFFYTFLYIPFVKAPYWKRKQQKQEFKIEALPERIRYRSKIRSKQVRSLKAKGNKVKRSKRKVKSRK